MSRHLAIATLARSSKKASEPAVATLDNGQVWSQSELNSRAHIEGGDTIAVRRGVLVSYLLVTEEGIATRARRLR